MEEMHAYATGHSAKDNIFSKFAAVIFVAYFIGFWFKMMALFLRCLRFLGAMFVFISWCHKAGFKYFNIIPCVLCVIANTFWAFCGWAFIGREWYERGVGKVFSHMCDVRCRFKELHFYYPNLGKDGEKTLPIPLPCLANCLKQFIY